MLAAISSLDLCLELSELSWSSEIVTGFTRISCMSSVDRGSVKEIWKCGCDGRCTLVVGQVAVVEQFLEVEIHVQRSLHHEEAVLHLVGLEREKLRQYPQRRSSKSIAHIDNLLVPSLGILHRGDRHR